MTRKVIKIFWRNWSVITERYSGKTGRWIGIQSNDCLEWRKWTKMFRPSKIHTMISLLGMCWDPFQEGFRSWCLMGVREDSVKVPKFPILQRSSSPFDLQVQKLHTCLKQIVFIPHGSLFEGRTLRGATLGARASKNLFSFEALVPSVKGGSLEGGGLYEDC